MIFYFKSLTVVVLLYFQASSVLAQPWQLEKDEQGIQIYLRAVPDSSIKEFKGEIRIKARIGSLLAVMNDTDACPQWVYNCAEPVLLEKISFTERYNFQISMMPLFITNRGLIFHTVLSQDAKSRAITMKMNASPDYCNTKQTETCQYIKKIKLIPITRSVGSYQFIPEPGGWTKVIWQQHIEPGGSLPGWLVNSLLLDLPYNTLDSLRTIVRNHKYIGMKLIYGSDGTATGFKSR
ncbi:MAG TPA: hypothetical protein ENI64_00520 [Gammaproteobacteria bacterium]|nr:hypothetical protein [Gammaproteobacteria bacterium]